MVEGFISELIKTLKLFYGEEQVRVLRPSLFILSSLEQKIEWNLCIVVLFTVRDVLLLEFQFQNFLKMHAGCGIGYRSL